MTTPWNTWVSTPTMSATPALAPGDVLRGVAQRFRAAELLEPDEMRVFPAQFEEQLRPGLEAVIGAVVDDRGQVDRGLENAGEMGALGRRRRAAREDARDDHQPACAFCLGVPGERRGLRGVLRPRADDDRQAGVRQALDALHPLLEGQERPVAHRSAIDEPRHSRVDELAPSARRGRRNPGVDRRRRASSGPAWFRKKLARTCWRFLESGRHVRLHSHVLPVRS